MFFYDINHPEKILLHFHGFGSSIKGKKTLFIKELLHKRKNASFFAIDMEYEKHTTSEILAFLDSFLEGLRKKFSYIYLSGSSHGGYILLNYLRFYSPRKIDRVFLWAPSLRTLDFILKEISSQQKKEWLQKKKPLLLEENGRILEIPYAFFQDIKKKNYEILQKDQLFLPSSLRKIKFYIVHGKKDDIVPIEDTRKLVKVLGKRVAFYKEVEEDHFLDKSFPKLAKRLFSSF